jgi:alkyl sulfatase BDS1-like metallo-beta-lactamase superfamily hydrolase
MCPDRLAQLWSDKVAAMSTAEQEQAQRFLARFGGARRAAEQAKIFLAQGEHYRAASIYEHNVLTMPNP